MADTYTQAAAAALTAARDAERTTPDLMGGFYMHMRAQQLVDAMGTYEAHPDADTRATLIQATRYCVSRAARLRRIAGERAGLRGSGRSDGAATPSDFVRSPHRDKRCERDEPMH